MCPYEKSLETYLMILVYIYIYICIYIYIYVCVCVCVIIIVLVVTISFRGFVVEQMRYNLENVQYLW